MPGSTSAPPGSPLWGKSSLPPRLTGWAPLTISGWRRKTRSGISASGSGNRQVRLAALSLGCLLLALLSQGLGAPSPLTIGLFLSATVVGGWETARKGFPGLFKLQFDMNSLMTVAVTGAVAIGYWEEAAIVAFLFGVSESLQAYTVDRARRSLKSLSEWAPREAVVFRDGKERVLPVEEVAIGDITAG